MMAETEYDTDELARRLERKCDALARELGRIRFEAIGADVQRQQTAADSFALGVFCALLALWFACRVSERLHALLPGALVDGLDGPGDE